MFERLFVCLLRFYPSRFLRDYQGEARQLLRDRFRDETGLLGRLRLCLDLILDLSVSLPQAYWTTSKAPATAPVLRQHVEGTPSFRLLTEEKTHLGLFLVGSLVTLTGLSLFSFVLSHEPPMGSSSGQNNQISPIEAVIQRLNQPLTASETLLRQQVMTSNQTKELVPPQATASPLPLADKALPRSQNGVEISVQQRRGYVVAHGVHSGIGPPLDGMRDIVPSAWQGTLNDPQQKRRIFFEISELRTGELTVLFESAGKGKQFAKAGSASFQDGVLQFTIHSIGATYKGKMAGDGMSIAGTWEQGTVSYPLLFSRVLPRTPLQPAAH